MKVPFFDLSAQLANYKNELLLGIEKVIDSGVFIGGDKVALFEERFAAFVGTEHALGVGNGLDAIRLILEALEIGPGDEVIVPGFTFYATWLAVLQVGATPVFVDVRLDDACIDDSKIIRSITHRTKAVLAVHLYGNVANLEELKKITDSHDIHLVEDVAQAHGAERDGLKAGSVGVAAAYSFYPTKNLGALGDAGAITTNDLSLAQKCQSRRSYGIGASKYEHVDTGWNTRLDPMQAAVLDINLSKLPEFTSRRREIASSYMGAISGFEDFTVGPSLVNKSVWHHFVIRTKNREHARDLLQIQGISTDVHYPYFSGKIAPLAKFKSDGVQKDNHLSDSKLLSEQVLSLPIGPWMSDAQIAHTSSVLERHKNEIFGL